MQLARPLFATDPKRFGKSRLREPGNTRTARKTLNDDLTLFATTFVAGFVVVSILIG